MELLPRYSNGWQSIVSKQKINQHQKSPPTYPAPALRAVHVFLAAMVKWELDLHCSWIVSKKLLFKHMLRFGCAKEEHVSPIVLASNAFTFLPVCIHATCHGHHRFFSVFLSAPFFCAPFSSVMHSLGDAVMHSLVNETRLLFPWQQHYFWNRLLWSSRASWYYVLYGINHVLNDQLVSHGHDYGICSRIFLCSMTILVICVISYFHVILSLYL